MSSPAAALALALAVAVAAGDALASEGTPAPAATGSGSLTGGDPCGLVEGLPGPKDPLRKNVLLRSLLRDMDRAGSDPKRLAAVHAKLEEKLGRLLAEASRVFHPEEPWRGPQTRAAGAWLEKHVLTRTPVLRIGDLGFEPAPGLRAALLYTSCRGGDREAAVRWGRRATAPDEAAARAFAALLLLEGGRSDEARELLPRLEGDSFLVAFVRAELATDPDLRRRAHADARRRIGSSSSSEAVDAQARRFGLVEPRSP